MKSSKQLNKRSFSPLIPKNIDVSDRKKKSTSNFPANPYRPVKDFDSHGRTDKKRQSNYLKDIIKQSDSANKYRIVTEPVDDRVITILSSSFLPGRSKPKLDAEHSASKARQPSQERRAADTACQHCKKYAEELNALKGELSSMMTSKALWRKGEITLDHLKAEFGLALEKELKLKAKTLKPVDSLLLQVKKHFYDLMKDIESLTEIDYPKMLALKIFRYDQPAPPPKNNQQAEIKELLSQLRNHYEGKINAWDLEDENEESDHVRAILRNLKARLSHYLRENLQLKTKKAILEKAEEISLESQDYLRQIVEDVLASYSCKT